jgi:metal-responsive CopG/Arc/MetJ family transcriptional regulator
LEDREKGEKVTIRLPPEYLRMLDTLVELRDSSSRSEAIRLAIRDYIYARIPMLSDLSKKMQEAEQAIANMEQLRRDLLRK